MMVTWLERLQLKTPPDRHPMYLISTLGFQADNFNAITNGIVNSIASAYKMLQGGTTANILMNSGTLLDSNIKYAKAALPPVF